MAIIIQWFAQGRLIERIVQFRTKPDTIRGTKEKKKEKILKLVYRIFKAVDCFHEKYDRDHYDIKPANIMMNGHFPVLIDLDSSLSPQEIGGKPTKVPITPGYMPPEFIKMRDGHDLMTISEPSKDFDSYSVGVTVFAIFSEKIREEIFTNNRSLYEKYEYANNAEGKQKKMI